MEIWASPRPSVDAVRRQRLRFLALCLPGAHPLADVLEAALRPVPEIEVICKKASSAEESASQLLGACKKFRPNLLLICVAADGFQGCEIPLEAARKNQVDLPILAVLEPASPDQMRLLISKGVVDFCLAPVRAEDLVPRLMRWAVADSEGRDPRRQLADSLGLQQLVGESSAFIEAISIIPKLARCDASVLILGETGTGKEMSARATHELSARAGGPFVPVNCGAIPSELVENELFGHEAGAFTGASSAAHGLVHDAEGGTLFLDEVDSLPAQTQVKFLRLLQEKEYRPVGSRQTRRADIRIISASNSDLEAAVRALRFRADLFYRLNVLSLSLPALRHRREDIPALARHFLGKCARDLALPVKTLSRSAQEKLQDYNWPGNIRELENTLQRAIVLSEGSIIMAADIRLPGAEAQGHGDSFKALKARAIAQFETDYIRRLLAVHEGNISQASRAAGKNRRAFWEIMRKHGILTPTPTAARVS